MLIATFPSPGLPVRPLSAAACCQGDFSRLSWFQLAPWIHRRMPSRSRHASMLSKASRKLDGALGQGLPSWPSTTRADIRKTPWRAREIMTDRTRASSSRCSCVSARKSGMHPSSAPRMTTQSNCCPLPLWPVSRCTPGSLSRLDSSPIRMRVRISHARLELARPRSPRRRRARGVDGRSRCPLRAGAAGRFLPR